jgi:dTDP-4-dehydrorhamnose reductase
MRSVVVAGVTGTIGRGLSAQLRRQGRMVIGASRTAAGRNDLRLDVTAPASTWPRWPSVDVTYVCIGAGGLETCERDPALTGRVHVDAVAELASRATATGSRVVLVSTSHVFNGSAPLARTSDPTCPATEYGRQKAAAELAVLTHPGAAVLRVSKVFAPGDSRLTTWRTTLLAGQCVEGFWDVALAPLALDDAVAALIYVGEADHSGLFQLSGPEAATYYSLARAVAAHIGAPAALVIGTSAAAAGMPAAFRPDGVLLEQRLPRPVTPAALPAIVARCLA